ncbi:hypothetical protein EON64_01575 [archaeon]|nr:MAG: hypothetical protein EON64_01575 [archaeon]
MFACSQIRLMMSAAILSTLRHLPSHFLALSLALPYHLPLPLAPSQGLLLKGGGFARNANGEDWAFGEASRGGLRDKLFMTRSEEEACEAFTKMHIYPRIEMDWMEGGVREDFERTMHKYRVPPSLAQQWAAMLDQHRLAERNTESGEEGGGSGLRRVAKNVERFQRDLQEGGLDDKPSAGHPKKKFSPNE